MLNKFSKIFWLSFFTLVLPAVVLANCQWFPAPTTDKYGEQSACGGDVNWKKSDESFCLPQLKKTGDTDCCCGQIGEATGCCICGEFDKGLFSFNTGTTKYFGTFTTSSRCAAKQGSNLSGTIKCEFRQGLLPATTAFATTNDDKVKAKICAADQNHCVWQTAANCSDVGLVVAVDPTWCRDSEKPNASTAKCCCGKNVVQQQPQQPGSTGGGNQPPIVSTQVVFDYGNMTNPLQTVNVSEVIGRVIKAILAIIGSIFLIMIIFGGFTWMTAAGNDAKVKKGRNILVWAIIGIIIIFLAWMLVEVIFEALAI